MPNDLIPYSQVLEDPQSVASDLESSDVMAIAREDVTKPTGFKSMVTRFLTIAKKIVNGIDYITELDTTAKTITGAINEVNANSGSTNIIGTASGAIATFSDGGSNIPLKSCEVAIVAQQASGTPSPSNPLSISGFSAVVVKDTGANLAPSNLYNGIVYATGLWDYVANRVTNYNGKDAVASMPYLQAGTYTINVTGLNVCTLLTKDASGNILDSFAGQWNNLPFTFTLTQAGYLFYTGRKSDNSNLTPTDHTPKVVQGSSIDMSEITTHTVSLGQTIYGGTADVVNGNGSKTYVNAVHTWSEFGNRTTLGSYVRGSLTLTEGTGINTNPNDLCNIATFKASYSADEGHFYIGVSGGNTIAYVFVPTGTSEDTSIQIVYELATPTTFTFTGAKIPTLTGENNIYSNTGDVEVEYFNENADQIAELIRVMAYMISPETIAFALICPRTQTSNLQYEVYNHTITRNCRMSIQTSGLTDCGSNDAYLALLVNGVEIQRGTLITDTTTSIDFSSVDVTQGDTVRLIFGWANNHGASFSGSGKMVLF